MNLANKSKLSLFAPAKLNLGLRVLGRGVDGYHSLSSLMIPLTIGDTLEVEEAQSGLSLQCNRPDIPSEPDSLLGKAFALASKRLNYKGGIVINLTKETPLGAGMGGGSSDAAAVMKAVETFSGKKLGPDDFAEIAFRVGADVPFFLQNKPCWMEGIGEILTPIEYFPPLYFIVVHPGLSISTKWVYSELKSAFRPRPAKPDRRAPVGGRIPILHPEPPIGATPPAEKLQAGNLLTEEECLAKRPASFGSVGELLPYLTNDLESVVLPQYPVVDELKKQLITLGGDAALMSGSGSALFGLFSDSTRRDAVFEKLKSTLEGRGFWLRKCEAPSEHSGVV